MTVLYPSNNNPSLQIHITNTYAASYKETSELGNNINKIGNFFLKIFFVKCKHPFAFESLMYRNLRSGTCENT